MRGIGVGRRKAAILPIQPTTTGYWLDTATGGRQNVDCRHYGNEPLWGCISVDRFRKNGRIERSWWTKFGFMPCGGSTTVEPPYIPGYLFARAALFSGVFCV